MKEVEIILTNFLKDKKIWTYSYGAHEPIIDNVF